MQDSAKTQEKTGILHFDLRFKVLVLQVKANVCYHPVLVEFKCRCDGYITADGITIKYGGIQLQRPS